MSLEHQNQSRGWLHKTGAVFDFLVQLHEPNQGPFAENSRRIKRRYIIPSA